MSPAVVANALVATNTNSSVLISALFDELFKGILSSLSANLLNRLIARKIKAGSGFVNLFLSIISKDSGKTRSAFESAFPGRKYLTYGVFSLPGKIPFMEFRGGFTSA